MTPAPPHDMAAREVRPEVWRRVVWFLYREVPEPRSSPARRDVRQGDLVSVMRVCSMLYDLAVPLLYSSVVVDNLPSLLYAHPRASCSGRLTDKASHLARIKHMYIEPTDKSSLPPDAIYAAHYTEISNLHRAMTSRVFTAPGGPFPALETLALGSIYPPDPSWDIFCRTGLDPTRGRMIRELSEAMPSLLVSPRLTHVCQRGGGGLLNFPSLMEDPPPFSAVLTTHFSPGDEYLSLPLGRACRWVLDSPHAHPHSVVRETVESVLTTSGSMRPWAPPETDQRILLEIYATGVEVGGFDRRVNEDLPPGWRWEGSNAAYWDCVEVKDMAKVAREMVGRIGGFGAGRDEVRWLPGEKAGRCGACGYG